MTFLKKFKNQISLKHLKYPRKLFQKKRLMKLLLKSLKFHQLKVENDWSKREVTLCLVIHNLKWMCVRLNSCILFFYILSILHVSYITINILISLKFLRCLKKISKKKDHPQFFLKTQQHTVSEEKLVVLSGFIYVCLRSF